MPYRTAPRVIDVDRQRRQEEEAEEIALGLRDHVMARCGAAIAALERAKEDVIEAMVLFVTPGEDRKGRARKEAIDAAIESASIATRALEDAMDSIDECDLEAGEPWEEVDDDENGAD